MSKSNYTIGKSAPSQVFRDAKSGAFTVKVMSQDAYKHASDSANSAIRTATANNRSK